MSTQSFKNKVAIITGAGTGNGEAIAEELSRRECKIVLAGRNIESETQVARRLDPRGERIISLKADVRDPSAVQYLVGETLKRFGALHYAINNAGVTGTPANIPDIEIEDWNNVIATDLSGVFYGLKYEIPAIIKSGGGAIVNLSSANGVVGIPALAAYTAAKHGIIGLTRSAALECAKLGVRINAIGPGYVDTPRMRETPEEIFNQMAQSHPMGRMAGRDEVAKTVAFLLSDESSFITGAFIPVDGGYTAQ